MMDIEKLIEQLRKSADFEDYPIVASFAAIIEKKYLRDAATALSTLQAENAQLRGELEYEREHANAYHEECGQWEAENEKLREKIEDARLEGYAKGLGEMSAELEQKEKYYEQMIDALSATGSADLAQMTACVYYKPGGLCRYGGDDPANVCVLGPCPHERTAEEVLADLARVTAERDAAIAAVKNMAEYIVCAGRVDYYLCDEISQEHHLKYQPKNDGNYDNEPCYKCIEDWFLQGNKW